MRRRSTTAVWRGYRATRKPVQLTASLPLTILVDHSGKLIEDVGWLWDHAQRLPTTT